MNTNTHVDQEAVEYALRDLRNAGQALAAAEYAFAIGFAATAHGLLYLTDARPALERLRDALVDRQRQGEDRIPDAQLDAALRSAHIAVSHTLDTVR